MSDRITSDGVGLLLARAWSLRSTCARRRVGCILVDDRGWQISSGYNGPASGMPHCTETPCPGVGLPSGSGHDECEALHAEWNAVARCPDVTRVHTCYVTTAPCVPCVKMLMNTSCVRIVFAEPYPAFGDRPRALWTREAHPRPTRTWEHAAEEAVIVTDVKHYNEMVAMWRNADG